MLKACKVCGSTYNEAPSEWGDKVPPICSSECFAKFLEKVGEERGAKRIFPEGEKRGVQAKNNARRSKEEIYFECFFERHNIFAIYEPGTTITEDGSWYLVDYYLPEYDCYMEVKGLWHPKAKRKVRTFPKDKRIFLIQKEVMQRLKISESERQEALKKKYVSPL